MEEQKKEKYKYGIWYERATGRDVTEEIIRIFETKEKPAQQLKGISLTSLARHDVVDGYIVPRDKTVTEEPAIIHDAFAFVQTHDLTDPALMANMITKKREDEEIQRQIDETIRIFGNPQRYTSSNPVQHRPEANQSLSAPTQTTHRRRRTDRYTPEQKRQIYQNARNKSHTKQKQSTRRFMDIAKQYSSEIIVGGIAVIMAVVMTLSVQNVTENITNDYNSHQVGKAMAQLLVPPNAEKTPSIVERHKHPTNDYQNFWYDNMGIAEDILELPNVGFDAYMFEVYNEMGINRKNNYIDNWGSVITAIGNIADPEQDPLAYARANGCFNFEDYMIKNGWVDEKGMPSIEMFLEHGQQAVNMYNDYLQSVVNARNNPTEDTSTELTQGGR